MARVLHRDPKIERVGGRKTVWVFGQELLHVEDTSSEDTGCICPEEMAIVLHGRATTGRIDHDRNVGSSAPIILSASCLVSSRTPAWA